MDLGALQFFYIGLAAFVVGFTKASVGGIGILAVLLMAMAIPGKASPGVLLPMLIAADIMAATYYRRGAQWRVLVRLLPAAFVGVLLGAAFLRLAPDLRFERIIGWIILAMLVLDLGLSEAVKRHSQGRLATAIVGVFAGASSMIANAAGPVFGIYLLQMGLKKSEFVGTRSWYFLVMNVAKLPFAIALGLVTPATLRLDLTFLPVIVMGALLGCRFVGYINIRVFAGLIRVAALAAAARLILF